MPESYSVKAKLSATDSGFTSTLKKALGVTESLADKIKGGFTFGILSGIGQKAFSTITGSVSGLISEVNSANTTWKTFDGNMKIIGKSAQEIETVKSSLKDFAQQTIYDSSEMSSTYSQLAAVGVDSALELVKGFGGLAASAENPKQAMKSLSQQATQMAAKPKVAWEDFKIMMEQAPAGMAAVAKKLGMSTSELVSAVQAGKIKTQDFFKAVEQVGNSDSFAKLATESKNIGQAMDGLRETAANKLMPAFDVLSKAGIKCVDKIADALGKLDAQSLADKVSGVLSTIGKYWAALKSAFSGVGTAMANAASAVKAALGDINGSLGSDGAIDIFKSAMKALASVIKSVAGFVEKHADAFATLIKWLPAIVIALKGFGIAKAVAPGLFSIAKGLSSIAGKGIKGIATKLLGIGKASKTSGDSVSASGIQMLNSAKSFALMGAAVLLIALGFGILAYSAISLANAGGGAIAVMAGLVIALAALGFGMGALMKWLAPMSGKLVSVGVAFLAMGAAVVLIAAGFWILAQAAIQLAAAGWPAIAVMIGLVAVIALLAIGAAALGPALTAGAIGFIAFGAAILLCSVGALLAAAALMIIAGVLPELSEYGLQGAVAILALGAAMLVFGAGALVAGAGAMVLGAGLLVVGAALVVVTLGIAALSLALVSVAIQMQLIADNAEAARTSLRSMKNATSFVEAGLSAIGEQAKSAMSKLKNAFDSTADKAESAGKKVGDGFTKGMQGGLSAAPLRATAAVTLVAAALAAGKAKAYSAGAYIGIGFANGMLSQLGRIRSAAAQMAVAAEKAVRAKAKIGSPSRVADKLGGYWGEGLANGISGMAAKVWDAAQKLVSIPMVATPDLSLAYGGELAADYDYYRNVDYTIEVPLTVDGKEFARATASYTQAELDRKQARDGRKRGRV